MNGGATIAIRMRLNTACKSSTGALDATCDQLNGASGLWLLMRCQILSLCMAFLLGLIIRATQGETSAVR
jgi:hypothetical protein